MIENKTFNPYSLNICILADGQLHEASSRLSDYLKYVASFSLVDDTLASYGLTSTQDLTISVEDDDGNVAMKAAQSIAQLLKESRNIDDPDAAKPVHLVLAYADSLGILQRTLKFRVRWLNIEQQKRAARISPMTAQMLDITFAYSDVEVENVK